MSRFASKLFCVSICLLSLCSSCSEDSVESVDDILDPVEGDSEIEMDSNEMDGDMDLDIEFETETETESIADGDFDDIEDGPGEVDDDSEPVDVDPEIDIPSEMETDSMGEIEIGDEEDIDVESESEPEPEQEEQQALEISVLTINLLNPLNPPSLDGDQRLQIIADFISAAQPDFVTSQEVVQADILVNRAERLSYLTGYHWHWEMTHDIPYVFEEGISILSKWPIVRAGAVQLPHEEFGGVTMGMFTRSVMGIEAQCPEGNLNVFCSHMTISEAESVKADQAAAILDFIMAYPSIRGGFFAGDLNATPEMLAMRLLRGDASHNGRMGNLTDAWMQANGEDPGPTYPAENPERRIDYIYVVPGLERDTETLDCELVLAEEVDGVRPSDHLGVLCRFLVY